MNSETRSSFSCSEFQNGLQRFLDGEAAALGPACDHHRIECASCRSDYLAAVRLARGLRLRARPDSPTGWTDRLVAAVIADVTRPSARGATRRIVEALLVAACLLLAVAMGLHFARSRNEPVPAPRELVAVPGPGPMTIEKSLADAGSAVASLTRRTADETIEPARKLISSAADSAALRVDPIPDMMDPANQSLTQIRQGAALGFEPVANSARRAVSLFFRDLPLDGERKPDL
jgi:predicted anti-sigma-YlaC factor YlaD